MVVIEKSPNLYFRSIEAIVSAEFQPHKLAGEDSSWCSLERLAAAKGSVIQIWALRFKLPSVDPKNYNQEGTTACAVESKCVCQLTEHTPRCLVALQWSPCGSLLASCDNRQIIIFEFVRFVASNDESSSLNGFLKADLSEPNFYEEQWKVQTKFTDPSFDLFDLCWFGNDQIITGSSDGIKIWNFHEKTLITSVRCTEGFVTGIQAYEKEFIALQSNDRRCIIFRNANNNHCVKLTECLNDSQTLSLGLKEIPYYRRPSFDCLGYFVSFPYGERSNQCFGFAYHLKRLKNDVQPTRFRGHCSRVNCVAFSKNVWRDIDKRQFTLYAQASLDGALSVWKCYYNTDEFTEGILATCLIVLRPRFLDEQASVTAMSWTLEGTSLIVASDDGCFTFVLFTLEELEIEKSLIESRELLFRKNLFEHCVCPPKIQPLIQEESSSGVVTNQPTMLFQSKPTQNPQNFNNHKINVENEMNYNRDTVKQARRRITPTVLSNLPSSYHAPSGGLPGESMHESAARENNSCI